MGHFGHAVVSDSRGHCHDGFRVRPCAKVRCGCGLGLHRSRHVLTRTRRWLPLTMFMTMGWIGALLAIAIYSFVGFGGLSLLLLGGLAFTVRHSGEATCRAGARSRANAHTRGAGGCTRAKSRTQCRAASASTRSGTWPSSWARSSTTSSSGSTCCPTPRRPFADLNRTRAPH